ncbi:MAG TPA: amidohydrolase family protein [Bryobacteraceae bacterium]|nr:amidohydrolase family protein [Bryobacteraceae bacterium]
MRTLTSLKVVACLMIAGSLSAQNLVINNARIIDGNGGVIQRGSIVVRDGRIVSVSQGAASDASGQKIDARGMTVMPGFIDDHRHVISDGSFPGPNPAQWMKEQSSKRMQEFLDAGFTTVQSCGDPVQQIVELQRLLRSGNIKGPRLFTAAFIQLARPSGNAPAGPLTVDPARTDNSRPPNRPTQAAKAIPDEETRATVRQLKQAGIDDVKAVIVVTPGGPEKHTLSVAVDEAKKVGMPVITHAVSVEDMFAAVDAGTTILAHTPHIGQLDEAGARKVAASKIPMMSTLGVFTPAFAEENQRIRQRTGLDQVARFRDLDPFPWNTLSSAGQGPVNARLLWEAGVVYGYGTDTTFLPKDSLAQELRPLRLVFSNSQVVEILTRNAATVIGHGKDLGTLEAGKQADIVMLDGDPLTDINDVLKVKLVIKDGSVAVDHRGAAK